MGTLLAYTCIRYNKTGLIPVGFFAGLVLDLVIINEILKL